MSEQQQPDLFDSVRATETGENELERILRWNGGWMLSRTIQRKYGVTARDIRAMAQASCRVISGNKGYRHMHSATMEEIGENIARRRAQIRTETDHVRRLEIEYHKRRTQHA